MDAELEFAIQPSTTGKQLFDQVSFAELVADLRLFLKKRGGVINALVHLWLLCSCQVVL
jgi:hypothetical protein